MNDDPDTRLNEYDADEWFDVCRRVRPGYTREQFDIDWEGFQADKAERLRMRSLH